MPDLPPVPLVTDDMLAETAVVANTTMNRERGLTGVNSYEKDLGFDPVQLLTEQLSTADAARAPIAWLDVCCGRGRALVDAARRLGPPLADGRVRLVGVDLVDHFDPAVDSIPGLTVVVGSLSTWAPDRTFELITCVHGLHYVGDKLGALSRIASWLSPTGRFRGNFDLAAFRWSDGSSAARPLGAELRKAGFDLDTRRHRISLRGGRAVALPFDYLGADPADGPNYTGQPAVASYYARAAR